MKPKDIIKNARFKLGKTQKEFALLIGVNSANVAYWEQGARVPGFSNIRKIVDKLNELGFKIEYSDFKKYKPQ